MTGTVDLSGTQVGRYRIVSLLGSGGMGAVYDAFDPSLKRHVALKVLPAEFVSDTGRLNRFIQEAQAASALNHPHLISIYEIGSETDSSTDFHFIAMEKVEGVTLRQKLASGALPVARAVEITLQISEAISAAHSAGVVHRDLKPENVMISIAGYVKVLDFGLAKLRMHQAVGENVATEIKLTESGLILGTVGYISPEQALGKQADHRSDIFSIGCILYETVCGRRAFRAGSSVETLHRIIHDDPEPLRRDSVAVPSELNRIVRKALAKDPEQRYQTAKDLVIDLRSFLSEVHPSTNSSSSQSAASGPHLSDASPLVPLPQRSRLIMLVIIASLILVGAAIAAGVFMRRAARTDVAPTTRFEISPPEGATLYPFSGPVAISPNGRMIAFFAHTEGRYVLWIRDLDSLDARRITTAGQGGSFPFWSPDSRSIGYVANGRMKVVDVGGGPSRTICETSPFAMGTWSKDGEIVFGGRGTPLFRVTARGGTPEQLTKLDDRRHEVSHMWPHFLPDGRRFLYLSQGAGDDVSGIYLGSLDSKTVTRLISADSSAIYAPPGFVLFVDEGKLVAVPFDSERGRVEGTPHVIANDVAGFRGTTGSLFSASENGLLVYATAAKAKTKLKWLSRTGQELSEIAEAGDCIHVALAPDGRRFAMEKIDPVTGNGAIWIHDVSRNVTSRLTSSAVWSWEPAWSAKGTDVFYATFGSGGMGIYQSGADAAGGERLLIGANALTHPTDQSADGSHFLFVRLGTSTNQDLWVASSNDLGHAKPFLNSDADEIQGQFSPDGRWVAYSSNESGRLEVYLRQFPDGSRKWQVSSGGGNAPRWSHDGKELFFISSDENLMSVPVTGGTDFEIAAPRTLFQLNVRHYFERYGYDVSPDGRFLANTTVASQPSKIVVVSNWAAELGR